MYIMMLPIAGMARASTSAMTSASNMATVHDLGGQSEPYNSLVRSWDSRSESQATILGSVAPLKRPLLDLVSKSFVRLEGGLEMQYFAMCRLLLPQLLWFQRRWDFEFPLYQAIHE